MPPFALSPFLKDSPNNLKGWRHRKKKPLSSSPNVKSDLPLFNTLNFSLDALPLFSRHLNGMWLGHNVFLGRPQLIRRQANCSGCRLMVSVKLKRWQVPGRQVVHHSPTKNVPPDFLLEKGTGKQRPVVCNRYILFPVSLLPQKSNWRYQGMKRHYIFGTDYQ